MNILASKGLGGGSLMPWYRLAAHGYALILPANVNKMVEGATSPTPMFVLQ